MSKNYNKCTLLPNSTCDALQKSNLLKLNLLKLLENNMLRQKNVLHYNLHFEEIIAMSKYSLIVF